MEFGIVRNVKRNLQEEHISQKRDKMYRCVKCGKDIEIKQVKEKIRCPYCGYKIIIKETPKTFVKVKAD